MMATMQEPAKKIDGDCKSKHPTYKCSVYKCLECEERFIICHCDFQCVYLTDSELLVPSSSYPFHSYFNCSSSLSPLD